MPSKSPLRQVHHRKDPLAAGRDFGLGSLSDQIGGCIIARLLVRSSYMS
jgi:hypothetical protein